MKTNYEKALFAAGCFWGVEQAFHEIPGVIETRVGYTGGRTENPTYEQVLSQETGHAETIEITFDPEKTSYEKLLEIFWKIHNPTSINRQGPDIGSNYRSAIFYLNEQQMRKALESKQKLEESKKFKKPIATEIVKADKFWPAEEYHQKYFLKHKKSTCSIL